MVKITTETASSGLEELAWADFNILAVEKNQEAFLDEVDIVDIVLVPKKKIIKISSNCSPQKN